MRRLTSVEYINSIKDIFEVDVQSLAASRPPEPTSNGFLNNKASQKNSPELMQWYEDLTEGRARADSWQKSE